MSMAMRTAGPELGILLIVEGDVGLTVQARLPAAVSVGGARSRPHPSSWAAAGRGCLRLSGWMSRQQSALIRTKDDRFRREGTVVRNTRARSNKSCKQRGAGSRSPRAIVESTSPRLLFETGLPILSDVTQCPYKGQASTGRCRRRPASTTTSRGLTGPARSPRRAPSLSDERDHVPRRYLDHNDLHAPRAQSRRGDRAVPALPAADALTIEGR